MRTLISLIKTCGVREFVPDAATSWPQLWEYADYHGLGPLLANRLPALTSVPTNTLDRARSLSRQAVVSNLGLLRELKFLVSKLDCVMPYKGPLLAEYLYGNLSLRTSVDIDIIVPPELAQKTVDTLLSYGYSSELALRDAQIKSLLRWAPEITLSRNGVAVDIHWGMMAHGFGSEIHVSSIFARSVGASIAGLTVRWPAPEDHLILFATHAAKHLWSKLIWLADTAALLDKERGLDLNIALDRAVQSNCRRMLLVTLLLCTDLFESQIPDVFLRQARSDPTVVDTAARVVAAMDSMQDLTMSRTRHSTFIKLLDRPSQRCRYAASLLLEPQWGDISAVSLPGPISFAYPAVRLLRLVVRNSMGVRNA